MELLFQFLSNTGYYLADYRHVIMIAVGSFFVYLAIAKEYEPLLLLPIGFGVLVVYSSSLMALVVGGLYISGELL